MQLFRRSSVGARFRASTRPGRARSLLSGVFPLLRIPSPMEIAFLYFCAVTGTAWRRSAYDNVKLPLQDLQGVSVTP